MDSKDIIRDLTATSIAVLNKVKVALVNRRPGYGSWKDREFYFGYLDVRVRCSVTRISTPNYPAIFVVREDRDGLCIITNSYPTGETKFPPIPIQKTDAINSPSFWVVPVDVVDRIRGQAERLADEALADEVIPE